MEQRNSACVGPVLLAQDIAGQRVHHYCALRASRQLAQHRPLRRLGVRQHGVEGGHHRLGN
jgi:hypothetical protein